MRMSIAAAKPAASSCRRQQGYTERTDVRQQGYTERTDARQQTAQSYQGEGGYYHDDYHDNDDWDDGEVAAVAVGAAALGAVGGYAAGQSSASSTVVYTTPPPAAGYTSLPCTPSVIAVSGVTYYQCGSTWYNQAYSGDSVTYVTVAPPPGY